jgi:hypothetical protein
MIETLGAMEQVSGHGHIAGKTIALTEAVPRASHLAESVLPPACGIELYAMNAVDNLIAGRTDKSNL